MTTGSKANDLRRGAERLRGRKGRLERSHYLFTPLEFAWFSRVFPGARLTVVSQSRFHTAQIHAIGMEDFLLERE